MGWEIIIAVLLLDVTALTVGALLVTIDCIWERKKK